MRETRALNQIIKSKKTNKTERERERERERKYRVFVSKSK